MVGLSLTLGLFMSKKNNQNIVICHYAQHYTLQQKKEEKKLNNKIRMKTAMQLKRLHKAEKRTITVHYIKKTCHTL